MASYAPRKAPLGAAAALLVAGALLLLAAGVLLASLKNFSRTTFLKVFKWAIFADLTYEGARSELGPYLAMLGASGAVVGIVSGFGASARSQLL